MKRIAGSPKMMNQQDVSPASKVHVFLFHYCPSFTPHFISALDSVVSRFLFHRNNTPFTSLHSLMSTKIGQAFKQAHPAERRHTRASTRHQISSAELQGVIMVKLSGERGNTFFGKITGITVFICSKLQQIRIWKFESIGFVVFNFLFIFNLKQWRLFSSAALPDTLQQAALTLLLPCQCHCCKWEMVHHPKHFRSWSVPSQLKGGVERMPNCA